MAKKEKSKLFPIIGGVLVIGIIAITLVLLLGGNKNAKPSEDKKPEDKKIEEKIDGSVTEADMIKAYGMSIKEAEDIVKQGVLSDNFEYSTQITNDYMYIVTVKDTLSDDAFKYEVNPVTKTAVALN